MTNKILMREMGEFLESVHRCMRVVQTRGPGNSTFDYKSPEGAAALAVCLVLQGLANTQGTPKTQEEILATATDMIRQMAEKVRAS